METKHTPGPWVASLDRNNRPIVWGSGTQSIADCYWPPVGDGFANARLIAAAPELLEVVRHLHTILPSEAWAGDARRMAEAAIAKATGMSSNG